MDDLLKMLEDVTRKALRDEATNVWRCVCGQKNRVDMAKLVLRGARCGKCGLPIPKDRPRAG